MSAILTTNAAAGCFTGLTFAACVASFDQGLAMAAIGGCFFYLGASASIPLAKRIFFCLGSCILGYLCGVLASVHQGWVPFAGVTAFGSAALGSTVFGALSDEEGGKTPRILALLLKLIPYRRG